MFNRPPRCKSCRVDLAEVVLPQARGEEAGTVVTISPLPVLQCPMCRRREHVQEWGLNLFVALSHVMSEGIGRGRQEGTHCPDCHHDLQRDHLTVTEPQTYEVTVPSRKKTPQANYEVTIDGGLVQCPSCQDVVLIDSANRLVPAFDAALNAALA